MCQMETPSAGGRRTVLSVLGAGVSVSGQGAGSLVAREQGLILIDKRSSRMDHRRGSPKREGWLHRQGIAITRGDGMTMEAGQGRQGSRGFYVRWGGCCGAVVLWWVELRNAKAMRLQGLRRTLRIYKKR